MRRAIGKPMTDSIRAKAIARLRKLAADGWPPGDVLSSSTLNCWQGLFPPKDDNGRQRPHGMAGNDRPRSGFGTTVDAALDFIADVRGGSGH